MSGTSLDGLDLAHCLIWQDANNKWQFSLEECQSISYDTNRKNDLFNAIHLNAIDLGCLHNNYGHWLGEQTKNFIIEHKLSPDFISSHGHTIHHRPEKGYTLQIGSGQHLAHASQQKVISDFRINDVALGGQGAPLVPIGDQLFFNEYHFCLNLGGISNISFVKNKKRVAYDIGLANMILNYITNKINLAYDDGGALAKSGKIIPSLLHNLNNLAYYKLPFPKSVGYEWFADKVIPLIENSKEEIADLLCTSVHHICDQIAAQVNTIESSLDSSAIVEMSENPYVSSEKKSLLITGGGALNTFLIETLQQKLQHNITIIIPDKKTIEFKEALIFGLMGVLRFLEIPNCMASVTGAKKDVSGGIIFNPL